MEKNNQGCGDSAQSLDLVDSYFGTQEITNDLISTFGNRLVISSLPPSPEISNSTCTDSTRAPLRSANSRAAAIVPPVARTSSMMTTDFASAKASI